MVFQVFSISWKTVFMGYDKLLCDMQIWLLGVCHIKCWNSSTVTVMISMKRNFK